MSESDKITPTGRRVVMVLVVIAILIPILLGLVLTDRLAYPTATAPPITTSSASGYTVYLPQGASTGSNFSPASLSVPSGATVTFVDQDTGAPHDVWFTSVPTGATNPNTAAGQSSYYQLTAGDSVSYTLTTPGTYQYECQFHQEWMQATIIVTG